MSVQREKPLVLVADDDASARVALAAVMEAAGYGVVCARDGDEAVELCKTHCPDIVILDVMMPRMDGRAACRAIRRDDVATPIVLLTAYDTESNELAGLGLGADDFVSKSASEALLAARVAALLRRVRGAGASAAFKIGSWRVSPESLEMRGPDGGTTPLTERQVAMLRLFANHPGEVFNRDFLTTRFWTGEASAGDHLLTVAIARLRRCLGRDGASLRTIHGVGYSWRPANAGDGNDR